MNPRPIAAPVPGPITGLVPSALLTLLAALTLLAPITAPGAAHAQAPAHATAWAERGRLVTYQHVRTLSRRAVRRAAFDLPFADSYASFDLDDFFDFYTPADVRRVTRHPIDVYRVIYETIDPQGAPIVASGAALVPRTGPRAPALWGLMRGTIFYDADAPSHGDMPDWGIWRGLLPAAAGYLVAMPDVLGFGASRHTAHTYLMPEPTATAAVDMLRATRHLAAELGVDLRDEVFVSGHSQGGHAALATQRLIEDRHADEFDLTAVAPAAGPYYTSAVLLALLKSEALIVPQVTSLYVLALTATRDLGRPLSYYFRAPYDREILELHDKQRDFAAILAGLPAGATDALYGADFLADLRSGAAADFEAAVAASDVHTGWTPRAPIRLYHGGADSVVPLLQPQAALAGLAGADIELIVVDGAEHLQTIIPATLGTIRWFDGLLDR